MQRIVDHTKYHQQITELCSLNSKVPEILSVPRAFPPYVSAHFPCALPLLPAISTLKLCRSYYPILFYHQGDHVPL